MILTFYRLGKLYREALATTSWDQFCAQRTSVKNIDTVNNAYILNSADVEFLKKPPKTGGLCVYTEAPTYFIDRYRFRHVDEHNPADLSQQDSSFKHIAFVGCSLTYGTSVPHTDIYPYLLSKKIEEYLGKPCKFYNISEPGISVSGARRLFRTITNLRSFDYVFFLLPPMERFEAVRAIPDSPNIIPTLLYFDGITLQANTLGPIKDRDMAQRLKEKLLGRTDIDKSYDVVRDIDSIIDICEKKDIKCFLGSWSETTYDFLTGYLEDRPDMLLPKFISGVDNQWGLDLSHPGKPSHEKYTNDVMDFLRSRNL